MRMVTRNFTTRKPIRTSGRTSRPIRKYAEQKAKLAKMLPDHDHADIGGADGKGAENSGDGKKAEKKRLKKEAKQM